NGGVRTAKPVKQQGANHGAQGARGEHTRRENQRGVSHESALGRPQQRKPQGNPGALLGGRPGGNSRRDGNGQRDR
ncbi:RNA helicase, partial [Paraburkholderia sp. BR14261]